MLLSLRDELRVVLSRDQVQLVRVGREITLRGMSYRVLEKKLIPCATDDNSIWANAVKTLETALSDLPNKAAFARIVLSNHFMRYAMVEWVQTLKNEAEEIAYAKHHMGQLFGTDFDSWELRLNQSHAGAPQLACAVDGQLLELLRATFNLAGVKLKSVQPSLMLAYNNCSSELKKRNAWFVQMEEGNLCLGLVQQGNLISMRTFKVGDDWIERLPEILDREAYLTELNTLPDDIYLWTPEHSKTELPKRGRWKFHKLQPVIRTSFTPEYDERFAMSMCG